MVNCRIRAFEVCQSFINLSESPHHVEHLGPNTHVNGPLHSDATVHAAYSDDATLAQLMGSRLAIDG